MTHKRAVDLNILVRSRQTFQVSKSKGRVRIRRPWKRNATFCASPVVTEIFTIRTIIYLITTLERERFKTIIKYRFALLFDYHADALFSDGKHDERYTKYLVFSFFHRVFIVLPNVSRVNGETFHFWCVAFQPLFRSAQKYHAKKKVNLHPRYCCTLRIHALLRPNEPRTFCWRAIVG